MPAYDWSPHPDLWFHHVHNAWIYQLAGRLNDGLLPDGFFAAGEQKLTAGEPDVFSYQLDIGRGDEPTGGGVLTLDTKPKTAFVAEGAGDYTRKEDVITVRTGEDETLVGVVEFFSRDNKSSRSRLRRIVEKTNAFLTAGVHVTMIELHTASPLAPDGMHEAIWEDLFGTCSGMESGEGRVAVAYHAINPITA